MSDEQRRALELARERQDSGQPLSELWLRAEARVDWRAWRALERRGLVEQVGLVEWRVR